MAQFRCLNSGWSPTVQRLLASRQVAVASAKPLVYVLFVGFSPLHLCCMLLLFRRLKILLRRFVRLGSFADHIKRALKLISISTLSHFDSGRLDNPFGQRNCPGRSDCGEHWYFQSANPPANPPINSPMNSPMNPSTNPPTNPPTPSSKLSRTTSRRSSRCLAVPETTPGQS